MTVKVVPTRSGLGTTHTRDVYYTYDLRGLQTSARFDSASGVGEIIAYDGFGRITSKTDTFIPSSKVLTFAYDKNGNRTSITHPGSLTWTMEYDGLDRMDALKYAGTALVAATYNTRGLPDALDHYSSALDQTIGYDTAGRLSQFANTKASNSNSVSWTFTRNPASQITSETRDNDSYAWTDHQNVDRNYTVNGLNQYTAAGSADFCHDANGNLTADGTNVYLYDVENRLVEMRASCSSMSCAVRRAASMARAAISGVRSSDRMCWTTALSTIPALSRTVLSD